MPEIRRRLSWLNLDDNGYSGIVIFDMAGVRVTLETGRVSHYRWDEHTQIYFEDGWVHTWAPPLLLKNTPRRGGDLPGWRDAGDFTSYPATALDMGVSTGSGIFHRKCSERHAVQIIRRGYLDRCAVV